MAHDAGRWYWWHSAAMVLVNVSCTCLLLGCVCFIHLAKQVRTLQTNEYESSKEWTKVIVWLQSERLAGYI